MIRSMTEKDRTEVLEMMRTFYASEAVYSNGSDEIFNSDIDNCIGECPYLEGYILGGETVKGYAMTAKSFSTEFGKPCIWIEDIYIKPEYRGTGAASEFLRFIEQKYKNALIRLEVEEDNEKAVALYKRFGFDFLPYAEMKKHSKS